MVYGIYNELVTGAFVNQQTSLGGLIYGIGTSILGSWRSPIEEMPILSPMGWQPWRSQVRWLKWWNTPMLGYPLVNVYITNWKITIFMAKSTISMAMFNSFLDVYQAG